MAKNPDYTTLRYSVKNKIKSLFLLSSIRNTCFSWERSCPGMKDRLTEFADNTLATGWLELVQAGTGFSVEHRVPGSQVTTGWPQKN